MFHDIIEAYADAMYVATTLRMPPPAQPPRGNERISDREERSPARSSSRPARGIVGWLWTRLGRGFGATAEPVVPIRPSFLRAPHS